MGELRSLNFHIHGIELRCDSLERYNPDRRSRQPARDRVRVRDFVVGALYGRTFDLPLRVTIVRTAPRRSLGQNLIVSARHVHDGVLDGLKARDGETRIHWVYQSELGPFSVHVTIEELPPETAIADRVLAATVSIPSRPTRKQRATVNSPMPVTPPQGRLKRAL